jgi:hypothetical protein
MVRFKRELAVPVYAIYQTSWVMAIIDQYVYGFLHGENVRASQIIDMLTMLTIRICLRMYYC